MSPFTAGMRIIVIADSLRVLTEWWNAVYAIIGSMSSVKMNQKRFGPIRNVTGSVKIAK